MPGSGRPCSSPVRVHPQGLSGFKGPRPFLWASHVRDGMDGLTPAGR
jgi:hypothetical protein